MKIYLAAMFQQLDEMRGYAEMLKQTGHEVTARWVYGGEDGLSLADIAEVDLADIDAAEAIVLFSIRRGQMMPAGGGRHVEFGYAMARGKILYVVGPYENVFQARNGVQHFETFVDLLTHLDG